MYSIEPRRVDFIPGITKVFLVCEENKVISSERTLEEALAMREILSSVENDRR